MTGFEYVLIVFVILVILFLIFRMAVTFYFETKRQYVLDLIEKAKELQGKNNP